MKKLKLFSVACLSLLIGLGINIGKVDATTTSGQTCKTYKYYYFFNEINAVSTAQSLITAGNGTWIGDHGTTFQDDIPASVATDDISGKFISLVRNGATASQESEDSTWNLATYYNHDVNISKNGTQINDSAGKNVGKVIEDASGDVVKRYYHHTTWQSLIGDTTWYDSGQVYSSQITQDQMIAGSIINPVVAEKNGTTYGVWRSTGNMLQARVYRETTQQLLDATTAFSFNWSGGGTADTILSPELYMLQFESCEEPKYKVTAHYYIKDTTDKVQADAVIASDLANGASDEYSCPTVDGYTLNTTSALTYAIEGADAELTCYYTEATGSNILSNVQTADFLIYIAWAVGAIAIGFAIWYYTKYYRKNKVK